MGYSCSAFSFIRIDMVHHQGNILLYQFIETASFWQDTTYQFMVDFTGSFLISTPAYLLIRAVMP